MYLDLTEILRDPGEVVERNLEIPAGQLDEWRLTEPVRGVVRAFNARRNIVVTGSAEASVELICARCLQQFSCPLHLELETAVPIAHFNEALKNAAVEVDEDNAGDELNDEEIAALFSDHSLNVTELVRQAIVLQAPLAPLCSEDCPGLPEAQQYQTVPADPRWAALRLLQEREKEGRDVGEFAPLNGDGKGEKEDGFT